MNRVELRNSLTEISEYVVWIEIPTSLLWTSRGTQRKSSLTYPQNRDRGGLRGRTIHCRNLWFALFCGAQLQNHQTTKGISKGQTRQNEYSGHTSCRENWRWPEVGNNPLPRFPTASGVTGLLLISNKYRVVELGRDFLNRKKNCTHFKTPACAIAE